MKRALFALVLLASGCDRTSGDAAPAASASAPSRAAASSAAPAAVSASASGAAPAASAPSAGADASWKGSYKAKVGAVNPPKEAKIQLWTKDDGSTLVGDGTIRLTITGTSVRGEAKGALGEQTITGVLDEKELSARVDPKNPNSADAMTGVLTGKVEGAAITTTLRVSGRNGNVVREATVTFARE